MLGKTIFITRDLAADSLFSKTLGGKGYQVFGRSMLRFTSISFEEIPECDWIFFYSKNGVRFFFEQQIAKKIPLPHKVYFAAMGNGTAEKIKFYGHSARFIGSGRPEEVASQFLKYANNKLVLFIRAQQSLKRVQIELEGEIQLIDLPVYRNSPILDPKVPQADILVFTSPLNAEIYFQHNLMLPGQVIVAIGPTTANFLANLGISDFLVASTPSEQGLLDCILTG